jgi:hypothetical protein
MHAVILQYSVLHRTNIIPFSSLSKFVVMVAVREAGIPQGLTLFEGGGEEMTWNGPEQDRLFQTRPSHAA